MQKMRVEVIDDKDGVTIGAEPVRIAYQGDEYEIDLSAEHKAELEELLAPWLDAARLTGRARGRRAHRSSRSGESRDRAHEIRAWAEARGIKVAERGRIPQKVVEKYEAHNGPAAVTSGPEVTSAPGKRKTRAA